MNIFGGICLGVVKVPTLLLEEHYCAEPSLEPRVIVVTIN